MTTTPIEEQLRRLLADVLHIGPRANAFRDETPLMGSVPELDSMGVVALLTAFEDRLGITIDDDEIDGSVFRSWGTLLEFVRRKVGA